MKKYGWGLLVVGGLLQIAETVQKADATVNNVTFDKTPIGSILVPIENVLPIPLGWSLVGAGAAILYFC